MVAPDGEGGVGCAVDGGGEGDVCGVAGVGGDETGEGGVVRGADGDVHGCGWGVRGGEGGGVVECDGEAVWGVLGPVEVEAFDKLDCLTGEGDGDGLANV